jgi:hypothetical protein
MRRVGWDSRLRTFSSWTCQISEHFSQLPLHLFLCSIYSFKFSNLMFSIHPYIGVHSVDRVRARVIDLSINHVVQIYQSEQFYERAQLSKQNCLELDS